MSAESVQPEEFIQQAAERKIQKLLENTNVIGDVHVTYALIDGLWHATYTYLRARHLGADVNEVKTIKFDANGKFVK